MDTIRATYFVSDEVVARDKHVVLNVTPDNIRAIEENVKNRQSLCLSSTRTRFQLILLWQSGP